MTGVEILSQETIYNSILPGWCMLVGLGLMAILVVIGLALSEDPHKIIGAICIVVAIFIFISAMVLCCTENKNNICHIEYKVTIDDSVSMNEFLDKYEIIGQEGKIYTVKEKD